MAGVVAALAAEARALGSSVRGGDGCAALGDGTLVAVSGIGYAAAESAAHRLIASGATALVSWGMAGGLDPRLHAGAVCLPREVIAAEGKCFVAAQPWRDSLDAMLGAHLAVTAGKLLTSVQPIDTVAAKTMAFERTGAAAVDMESSAVACAALAHDLPFIAVRAIVDTAGDTLPPAVTAAGQSGQVNVGRLILGLFRSPADLRLLLRLARRYKAATRSLEAIARLTTLAPPAAALSRFRQT